MTDEEKPISEEPVASNPEGTAAATPEDVAAAMLESTAVPILEATVAAIIEPTPAAASTPEADPWQEAMAEQAATSAASAQDDWSAALAEQEKEIKKEPEKVERAQLPILQDESKNFAAADSSNLKIILDIPVTLSMEVGKVEIPIRQLLNLNQGSVVELDRFAGDPLDVYVNGKLIAHGEVVVINDKFGIRLTDVVSAEERIKELS
jgi:flagellar motor switch protein FliN/FliY